jgi:hypothetical protein
MTYKREVKCLLVVFIMVNTILEKSLRYRRDVQEWQTNSVCAMIARRQT